MLKWFALVIYGRRADPIGTKLFSAFFQWCVCFFLECSWIAEHANAHKIRYQTNLRICNDDYHLLYARRLFGRTIPAHKRRWSSTCQTSHAILVVSYVRPQGRFSKLVLYVSIMLAVVTHMTSFQQNVKLDGSLDYIKQLANLGWEQNILHKYIENVNTFLKIQLQGHRLFVGFNVLHFTHWYNFCVCVLLVWLFFKTKRCSWDYEKEYWDMASI